ncbi:MAG: hypothetical protein BJ554DRAFT_5341 [Olpidium bornovanus]|uniref:Uncharacterized protein n=1 Tax=Olpidium bornovanus TaxID=278681 RepID=A0A8H7ZZU6_9FUNG|nr:MAG: hypothetical protein BJ554DRAFT_5341 [Olpidium bornovanus]
MLHPRVSESLKFLAGELETVPPGFERGLSLSTADADDGSLSHDVAGNIFDIKAIFSGEADSDLGIDEGEENESLERPDELATGSHLLDMAAESHERERAEVDELLPEKVQSYCLRLRAFIQNAGNSSKTSRPLLSILQPLLASAPALNKRSTPAPKREWAHVVDVNADFPDFHELVPDMAFKVRHAA